jgi:cell division transport system permease protein
MGILRLTGVALRDAARDLGRQRGQNMMAVLTLGSGLFLAGGGLLAVESLDRWVGRMEALTRITLFAAEGSSLDEAEAALTRDPRFRAVRRVSSEEATRSFQEATREAGMLLDSLGTKALPESLELSLRPDLVSARKAPEVGDSLRKMPGVGDVIVDQERLEALQRAARLFRSLLGSLGGLLLLAAGFSTGNVIRMTVLAREEEIVIMRLVGATESFIRTPMVLTGALLGLLSSLVAAGALFLVWWPLNKGVGNVSPLLVDLARTGFFSSKSLGLLALVGTGTGALGALWGFWSTHRARRKEEARLENLTG